MTPNKNQAALAPLGEEDAVGAAARLRGVAHKHADLGGCIQRLAACVLAVIVREVAVDSGAPLTQVAGVGGDAVLHLVRADTARVALAAHAVADVASGLHSPAPVPQRAA